MIFHDFSMVLDTATGEAYGVSTALVNPGGSWQWIGLAAVGRFLAETVTALILSSDCWSIQVSRYRAQLNSD